MTNRLEKLNPRGLGQQLSPFSIIFSLSLCSSFYLCTSLISNKNTTPLFTVKTALTKSPLYVWLLSLHEITSAQLPFFLPWRPPSQNSKFSGMSALCSKVQRKTQEDYRSLCPLTSHHSHNSLHPKATTSSSTDPNDRDWATILYEEYIQQQTH